MLQNFIKKLKDKFEEELVLKLALMRVSAPLFVEKESGLNDYLGTDEKPISFNSSGTVLEIVQSLAKWKRFALKEYNLKGLYTDMNAIRPNETLDYKHSLYVDQWDWEKVIKKSDRTLDYLKETVQKIYACLQETENYINSFDSRLTKKLPETLEFISSLELYEMYPKLTPEDREREFCKTHKAFFVYGIGFDLPDGKPHGLRASDYDDWLLNGDLIVWDKENNDTLELSSMGIRVDKEALLRQKGNINKTLYSDLIISDKLPLTIGGGIGQSRIAMFLLEKKHIGEVQVSWWPEEEHRLAKKKGIILL